MEEHNKIERLLDYHASFTFVRRPGAKVACYTCEREIPAGVSALRVTTATQPYRNRRFLCHACAAAFIDGHIAYLVKTAETLRSKK